MRERIFFFQHISSEIPEISATLRQHPIGGLSWLSFVAAIFGIPGRHRGYFLHFRLIYFWKRARKYLS